MLGNLRHGKGTYTLDTGAVYSGQWRYDALEGRGRAAMPDGQTYDGEWRGGKAKGCGSQKPHHAACTLACCALPTRPLRCSTFAACVSRAGVGACRHGVARYQNGSEYTGDFEADVRHGWGLQTFPTGDRYEGEWASDRIHGEPPGPSAHMVTGDEGSSV